MSTRNTAAHSLRLFPLFATWARMPAFVGWLALSLGVCAATALPWHACPPLFQAAIEITLCLLGFTFLVTRSALLRALTALACGVLVMTLARGRQYETYERVVDDFSPGRAAFLAGRIVSVPLPASNDRGYTYLVRCDSLTDGLGHRLMQGALLRCRSKEPPDFGRSTIFRGMFRPPRLRGAAPGFDEYGYLLASGIQGTFYVSAQYALEASLPWTYRVSLAMRHTVYQTLGHVHDPGRRSLLLASLIGEVDIPAELQQAFTSAGFAHLLALSGLNVAIVAGALAALLRPLPLPPVARTLVLVASVWCYVFVAGPIPSLVRATIMATVLLAAPLFQRKSYALNALGVAGIIWLGLAPQSLFTAGYQLSFAATMGLIMLFPALKAPLAGSAWLRAWAPRLLVDSAIVSLAAFAATAPVLAYHFGTLSVFGLVANVVAVGLMTVCTWAMCAGVALQPLSDALCGAAMWVADGLMRPIVGLAYLARHFPLAHVAPFTGIGVGAYAAYLAGLAAAPGERLARYVLFATPALLLIGGAAELTRCLTPSAEVYSTPVVAARLTCLRLPDGSAWMLGGGACWPDSLALERALGGWLRHSRARLCGAVALACSRPSSRAALPCSTSAPAGVRTLFATTPCLPAPAASRAAADSVLCNGDRFVPAPQCTCEVELGVDSCTPVLRVRWRAQELRFAADGSWTSTVDSISGGRSGIGERVLLLGGGGVRSVPDPYRGHPLRSLPADR
jgi:ComEC/Rec2-related protein